MFGIRIVLKAKKQTLKVSSCEEPKRLHWILLLSTAIRLWNPNQEGFWTAYQRREDRYGARIALMSHQGLEQQQQQQQQQQQSPD
ncbi:unnamed protein product [Arctogadus glacialis]